VRWLSLLPVRESHPLEAPSLAWRAEIGAGQIVEEHLEPHMEQRLPALPEIREEIPLMGQPLVQASIHRLQEKDFEVEAR
jgi:hypothetical protein